jgi:phage protein D
VAESLSFDVFDQQGSGSRVYQPFSSVFVNQSDILTGVIDIEVTNASHFTADTFRLTASIAKLPPDLTPLYWGDSAGDELEIFAGVDSTTGQTNSLIYGQVDDVDIDLVRQTMTLSGRDLSARFLDVKTAEHFQDQTASNIATTLAARHGMKASVTPTTQRVGGYYEYYHSRMNKDQSEWDLLVFLAEQEGYDLWVAGQTLYFQPPVPATADPYVLLWSDDGAGNFSSNMTDIRLKRSQTLAKDVIVKVQSWNQAQETVIKAENHRNQADKGQRAGGNAQIYTFYPPNLNKEQADKWAAAKAEDITKHERVISGSLPGDNLLTNRSLIKLVGTNTGWDQLYNIDTVTRRLSSKVGYTMDFRAKNHSTQSTIII